MNAADILRRSARLYDDRPVLYFRDRPMGRVAFDLLARKGVAILADAGVAPGDRVAILAGNKPEWLACYFAILAVGAVIVPINPALTPNEIAYIVDDSAPAVIFVDDALRQNLAAASHHPKVVSLPSDSRAASDWDRYAGPPAQDFAPVAVAPEDPSIIYYTSGTTGRPKGAVMPHRSTLSTYESTARWLGLSPADTVVITGSFAFILHSTLAAGSHLGAGGTLVIQERFHPQNALTAILRYRGTVIFWVPTMYVMACEFAEKNLIDLSSLRICISAGAPLPWAVAERFHALFGKHVLSGWGMSEGTPVTGFDPSGSGRPESIGKPLEGCVVRVLDNAGNEVGLHEVGELVYLSPKNMTGYLKRPAETAETLRDGWIHSGDLGWRDQDGYLYISGRKKDMIIRGGAKIYPAEVEEIVMRSEDILESAIVGGPDIRFGERIVAFVTAREGKKLDLSVLRAYCEKNLASYKVPQEFIVVDDLPRGPTGKILKRVLRDRLFGEAL
ncbi:class I adenylate-forming enzyme family protein [Chelatococcus reniformis]|uniref:3-methylmercaptopropionyl-CoA ligase n=1 Tax=Chelatococcus reniformis TaxID=1494448 RepID=A0A916UMJ4_9HYPH|nr:AMP-binding protein [Chelatococcus reniformis]GGC77802.1 long-chain-fatty-acid--CoA ligase [Chelatococcus reniformis]